MPVFTAWRAVNFSTRQSDGSLTWKTVDVQFQIEIDLDTIVDDMKHAALARGRATKINKGVIVTRIPQAK